MVLIPIVSSTAFGQQQEEKSLSSERELAVVQWPESQPVFEANETKVPGHTDGTPVADMYQNYREPVVVKTKTGRIIVGCHAGNKLSWPERSGQDLVIRYSDDKGKTWSTPIVAAEHGNFSIQSHGLVYDRISEKIIFLYNVYRWDYSEVEGRGSKATAPVIQKLMEAGEDFDRQYMVVSDDGRVWSEPRDITPKLENVIPHYGAAEGRQLINADYAGRLILPGGLREEKMGEVIGKTIGIWYSDDHGDNWEFVEIKKVEPREMSIEARVTELYDGSLLYNVRSRHEGRKLARSTDGGLTWSELQTKPELLVTQCNGSMITLTDLKGKLTSNLMFSVPSPGGRNNGFIYGSKDGGKSWPIVHQPVEGFFAYSALIQIDPETVGLFYEANEYRDIRLMRISVSDLIND